MKIERTICDSCKKQIDATVESGLFKFKVKRGSYICGPDSGWFWHNLDLCRECFSGLKLVWEKKCEETQKRVNP